ncbi:MULTISPECIES: nucleotide pyrophosphohydrolase [Nocardioides]|uniref:Nucleotide pyrophosphohydrolase n=1 Tax=Nocardioides vastitatis TaxID=2568655 RepID=A0ABW0ZJ91_9ACTN|nr:nucleotide pyrophosphohydrolase [Nocardioides sp.]THJ07788.1 nucleotide pyrophosphohydrolase [Nocardioides sp.]
MVDESVLTALKEFVSERDWDQFHTPASLARSVVIEAAELLECFQWSDQAVQEDVRDELADVLTYCLLLANKLGLDPGEIVLAKLESTKQKYPIDKAHGRSAKYDRLPD